MDSEKNIQQESNEAQQEPVSVEESKKGAVGPIIGSIVVIILIVLGGFYYWGSTIDKTPSSEAPTNQEVVEEVIDEDIQELEEIINTNELDNLDNELDAIEAEIDAELNNL